MLFRSPNADQLVNTVLQSAQYQLVEPQWASLVEQWKKDAIAVFGCTARTASKFIDRTIKHLSSLDVSFTGFQSSLPHFQYGVLFCSTTPKGIALLDLLPELTQDIKTVIMIDDRVDHLESISAAIAQWNLLHATNIDFVGFHYTAAHYLDNALDINVVERQLAHLIETGTYLSDIAAAA